MVEPQNIVHYNGRQPLGPTDIFVYKLILSGSFVSLLQIIKWEGTRASAQGCLRKSSYFYIMLV